MEEANNTHGEDLGVLEALYEKQIHFAAGMTAAGATVEVVAIGGQSSEMAYVGAAILAAACLAYGNAKYRLSGIRKEKN